MENDAIDPSVVTQATPTNPHVLWRQVLGLALWVGIVSFVAGGYVTVVLCGLLAGLTFADAWISGIYKNPEKKAFTNLSPLGWGIAVSLLLLIGYPTYLLNRGRLRTIRGTNLFYWAVVVLGGLAILFIALAVVARLGAKAS